MKYQSTRSNLTTTAAKAICSGIAPDGGLFIPVEFPAIKMDKLLAMQGRSYADLAGFILQPYFEDWPEGSLSACLEQAYQGERFDTPEIAPAKKLSEGMYVLELWHGPTAAFKDMALQFLPPLMAQSKQLTGDTRTTVILTATSGDTGKAALEGFADQPGIKIVIFYPSDGVSEIQRRQMVTQAGENVDVIGIDGNFDDAQNAVKKVFTDADFAKRLAAKNMTFSSANSINFGRLAPQIVYYFTSYLALAASGEIKAGEPINFAVPTGNFGNILAGYYAKRMGLPIAKLICASNANHVLADFFATADYNRNRPFIMTESPSMDILISSNLERLVSHLAGPEQTKSLMEQLVAEGRYSLPERFHRAMAELFVGGFLDDSRARQVIQQTFRQSGYLLDTHTAVAMGVYQEYRSRTADRTKTVVLSTASPYKFAPAVLIALNQDTSGDGQQLLDRLSSVSRTPIPHPLNQLWEKPVRFDRVLSRQEIESYLASKLQL